MNTDGAYHADATGAGDAMCAGIAMALAENGAARACAERGIMPEEYTPAQVKQSVVGYGRAEKKQVMEMTRSILGLPRMPRPDDAADALALAICHAHTASSHFR